jgi:hypothetical protein
MAQENNWQAKKVFVEIIETKASPRFWVLPARRNWRFAGPQDGSPRNSTKKLQ